MSIRHGGRAAIGFGLAAGAVYGVMMSGPLAHLAELAQAPPFDLRPAGYTHHDAVALLTALGDSGRRYYLMRQIPLDLLYPALLALTLRAVLRWRAARFGPVWVTRLGGPLAILGAGFDYLENLGIGLMLLGGPGVHAGLVAAASTATILKSGLTVLAVLCVILALLPLVCRRLVPHAEKRKAGSRSRATGSNGR